jgi:uncharacterized membrane protein (Fun14 family)
MCDQLSTSVLFCVLQSYTKSYYECRRFNSFCNFSGWGFFIGVLFGYFVKKIIKIGMFVTGGIVGLLLYLQQQQIISVNMEKFETSSTTMLTSLASTFDTMTQVGDFTFIEISLTASIAAGFTVALAKS